MQRGDGAAIRRWREQREWEFGMAGGTKRGRSWVEKRKVAKGEGGRREEAGRSGQRPQVSGEGAESVSMQPVPRVWRGCMAAGVVES